MKLFVVDEARQMADYYAKRKPRQEADTAARRWLYTAITRARERLFLSKSADGLLHDLGGGAR
jgi:hypothetical protein